MIDTVLLVIDFQRGLFKKQNKIFNEDRLIKNINILIKQCRQKKIPIIFIRHTNNSFLQENSEDWQIHPRIEVEKRDLCFNKKHSSLFKEKKILKELETMEIKNLIITGLVTHGCVKAACIDAKRLGYGVTLVKDGHSNFNNKAEELINEWNIKLSNEGVIVLPTSDVFH